MFYCVSVKFNSSFCIRTTQRGAVRPQQGRLGNGSPHGRQEDQLRSRRHARLHICGGRTQRSLAPFQHWEVRSTSEPVDCLSANEWATHRWVNGIYILFYLFIFSSSHHLSRTRNVCGWLSLTVTSSCRCGLSHCGQLPLCSGRSLRVILSEHRSALWSYLR